MKFTNYVFAFAISLAAVSMTEAQEFTHTTTASNIIASRSILTFRGLVDNPNAIVVATPTAETVRANPHPIGAWFYNGKWHIFNTDHANLAVGLVFKVQAYAEPGPNQFLHIVTRDNVSEGASYIDNPATNNNPNVQLIILQNHAPDNRAFNLNPKEARATYNSASGRWYIANVDGKALFPNTAYNVVVSGSKTISTPKLSVHIPELTIRPTVADPPAQPAATAPEPTIPATGPCTKEMAWQTVGKWAPQKKADVAMADRTFPKAQYKAVLAKAQKAIDLFMQANPEFKGIEASAYSGIRGDSIIPNGPLPFRADIWYKSFICVGNDTASVDKRGKIIVWGNYGFTTVAFNTLSDVLESAGGLTLSTASGDEIFQYNRDLGEQRGFPLIQTSHRDSYHEAVIIASNDRLPYKPITREQYLHARIKMYQSSGGMADVIAGLNRVLANMSASERSAPAIVRDVTTLPGGTRLFATEAEGGRHLVTIDKSYFNPKLPRDTIQLITIRWNSSKEDRPKVEMIEAFKRNFDFIAMWEMLGH